ncbi:replication initiation protein [Flammeovirga kamogawensis]|uniref:Replication initiation protein n=1 Tax=Flammeovirga kamogawensis TaxID=373891 RepID=A0ABX8H4H3_9BACT|nr:replication initiation protein [Flammeovirga kamogawensis]MBB6463509.1 plasmid replication initiation protein [Flammeovirga kamogawensis]QWG10568.1 replication initiation protein [Flammeovirga kamogawensis]TRX63674.1 replication initiation protein [Flammeovirga kamogawensis]
MDNILTKVWVKRHNNLVRAHQKTTLSLTAQKLLLFAFTHKEQEVDKVLEFRVADFLGRNPGGKDIKNIDQACDELSSSKIKDGSGITDNDYDSKDFNRKYITLFDTIEINKTRVSFKFNRTFKQYLGPSSNYTQYLYSNLKDMRSPHAVRLYDFITGGVGKYDRRKVELNELKSVLGVSTKKSYNVFNTFKNSVLEPAVKGIDKTTDIHLSYEPIRERGRKYTHIIFYFHKKKVLPKLNDLEVTNADGLTPENAAKVDSMRAMNLSDVIIQATIKELLNQQKESVLEDIEDAEVVTSTIGQQDLFSQKATPTTETTANDFDSKVKKIELRLSELGLPKNTIQLAVKKYKLNPKLKIWIEMNNLKMAVRDGQPFPNKHTLKKWIEEND